MVRPLMCTRIGTRPIVAVAVFRIPPESENFVPSFEDWWSIEGSGRSDADHDPFERNLKDVPLSLETKATRRENNIVSGRWPEFGAHGWAGILT